jgi:hypothetical protein
VSAAPTIIAEWPKNERETVRVALDEFNGHSTVNARLWFRAADGEMRPGKGLAIGIRHLPALAAALNEALAVAIERSLIQGDSAN